MALLDVSDVLLSPEFMQPIKVYRKYNGRWEMGKFIQDECTLILDMLVSPVNEREINMIPEGDSIKDAKTFHCLSPLYLTQDDKDSGKTGNSDILEWKGSKYKLVSMSDFSDYGYYKPFGVLMRGY
jgi:hypothetical protein